MAIKIKQFGVINVSIDGNGYTKDMIVKDIKKVLENYLEDYHLFVNDKEVELIQSPYKKKSK